MATIQRYWILLDVAIVILLTVAFGFVYLSNHAWGSWGDDSPGYIYTAGQLLHNESLVSQDDITQQALDYFGSEPLARFVTPTHHEIISPSGWLASRYPIGLGALLYFAAKISGNDETMYFILPGLAVGVVILTYILGVFLFQVNSAYKRVIGIMAALSVGLANLFANYAVSQPMREIPSMFFFLLAFVGIFVAAKLNEKKWLQWASLAIAGLAFGYSINIRETSAILILPIAWLFFYNVKEHTLKKKCILFGIFMAGVVLAASLSIWNSTMITAHKEKFREKDISRIAITSNFDHVRSLQIQNLYNNQGKFRPGVGGVNQYWGIMQQFSYWPPFLLFAALGVILLWKSQRRTALFLGGWVLVIFLLFSAWINPYPRYILPLLPAIALISAYGTVRSVQLFQQWLRLKRMAWLTLSLIIVGSFLISLQPSLAIRQEHIAAGEQVFKALSRDDLQQTKNVAQIILEGQHTDKPAVLFMVGQWKAGMSEMIMTHSTLRTIRYPRKPKEQPPLDDLLPFLQQLNKTYELYMWYDSSANADEQKLRTVLDLEFVHTFDFSFQPGVEIYRIEY